MGAHAGITRKRAVRFATSTRSNINFMIFGRILSLAVLCSGFAASCFATTFYTVTQFDGIGANLYSGKSDSSKFFTVFAHAGDTVSVDLTVFGLTGSYTSAYLILGYAKDGKVELGDSGMPTPVGNGAIQVMSADWVDGSNTTSTTDTISVSGVATQDGDWIATYYITGYPVGETPYVATVSLNGVYNVDDTGNVATMILGCMGLGWMVWNRRRLRS